MAEIPLDNLQVLSIGGILFLMALWAVARAQRRLDAHSSAGAIPAGHPSPDPALQESLRDLLLRLEETSRRVGGQIDTKLTMLNRLLAEADLKINELKTLAAPGRPAGLPPSAPSLESDPQIAAIWKLADDGLPPVEIARKTGRPRGEVDFILSLRRMAR